MLIHKPKFDFGQIGIASLEKQGIMHTKKSFWRILYTILNAMPISEMFEEKIQVLQAK
jgi:hypothetical protein